MGEAIAAGLLHADVFDKSEIIATVRRDEVGWRITHTYGIEATTDNVEACRRADIVLVALKPQRMQAILDDDALRQSLEDKLVVSLAAGTRLEQLTAWLPRSALVRAMPNTPCLTGAGMTVLARGANTTDEQMLATRHIFEAVGRVLELEDKHMDAVTSLNGSGPAFAYVVLEALADGGVMMGLPRGVALEIAAQVFLGSAKMVLETGAHPAALKDQVTTPAGSTIAGLLIMEDGRIRSVLARAIQEATRVAASLGKS
jgi:pyrroline-5-carboxylate reductase